MNELYKSFHRIYTHIFLPMLCVRQRSDLYASGMIRKKFYGTSAHHNLLIHDTNVVSFRVKKRCLFAREKKLWKMHCENRCYKCERVNILRS